MSYTVGDRVQWTSQSGGHTATKTGEVLAVVPAGMDLPTWEFVEGYSFTTLGYYTTRDHESYLVAVPGKAQPGTPKPKLYWPRVSHLQPAGTEATDELAALRADMARMAREASDLVVDVRVLASAWQAEEEWRSDFSLAAVDRAGEAHEAAREAAGRH